MKLKDLQIGKYAEEYNKKESELELEKINNALKELHYYEYCNKNDGDICEHIHCICRTMHIGRSVTATCSRNKYGK